jgi:hypothetical protein
MVGAPQLIILFWCGSPCGLDALWFVKLKLAARWLSSPGVDKPYRELSEGRLTAGSYRLSICSLFIAHCRTGTAAYYLDIAGLDGLGSPKERISVRLSSAPGRHASLAPRLLAP